MKSKDIYRFDCGCEFETMRDSAGKITGLHYDVENVPLDCPKVWDMVGEGLTLGAAQVTSQLGRSICIKAKPRSINELSDVIAIMRPGCLDSVIDGKNLTNHYIDRKNGKDPVVQLHPSLAEITKDTYGIMIFQEIVLAAAKLLAGFNPVQARKLQKAMGKKNPEIMSKLKSEFAEGCANVGKLTVSEAEQVFDIIEANQRYSFNKCVSPNTSVQVSPGNRKKLQDLKVGDKVLDHKSNYVEVKQIYDNGRKNLYRFTLTNGYSIECTLDHKLLCWNRNNETYELLPAIDALQNRSGVFTLYARDPIYKVEYLGYLPTLDIEVDNLDHIFMGNGIAISNSHSLSYSVNSYLFSLYPKAHFPRAFFTSQLQFIKELTDIEAFVEDAKAFGVVVKKPDLRNNNVDFAIKGEDIVFGLSSIKGVGESTVKSLLGALEGFSLAGGSWIKFMFRAAPAVNSGALKAIIKAGAVDCLMTSRARMLFELTVLDELNDKQVSFLTASPPESLEAGITAMIRLGTGKFTMCATKKSLEKLQNTLKMLQNPPYSLQDSYRSIAQMEREMCGYEFTCTELDGSEMLSYASHSCEELIKARPSKTPLRVPALIKRVKTHKSGNGEMAFIEFRDSTASVNFGVCFAGDWERLKGILYENNKTILVGTKNVNPGKGASFMINGVHQI